MQIRDEQPDDIGAVHAVNVAAFETPAEAHLVDVLRQQAHPVISLVAVDEHDGVVGHVLFSPVTISGHPQLRVMGLGPMAVLPSRHRLGIGTQLVQHGLEECRRIQIQAVVVIGHPDYYPRFGFVPASRFELASEYDVPDEVFMALEITKGTLPAAGGTVRYHPAFASV